MSYVSNPCTRCGKERILLKKWTEEIQGYGNNKMKVTRSLNVCPDPDCQELVDKELAIAKKKRTDLKEDRDKKLQEAKDKKASTKIEILE